MTTNRIQFGTEGWRAEIAREFTFDNVALVSEATARYFAKLADGRPVVVGYDRRFLSDAFARTAAAILAAHGLEVLLARTASSTPEISWTIRRRKAAGGVILTASHNPPTYNGYKIKSEHGGPAQPEIIRQVERELADFLNAGGKVESRDFQEALDSKAIRLIDTGSAYLNELRRKVDLDLIARQRLSVMLDPMHGSGIDRLEGILDGVAESVDAIHNTHNPSFSGINPEPIEENLFALGEAVVGSRCDIGIANDGDADRVGIVDETGRFIGPQAAFALLLMHLHEDLGRGGRIVKTNSVTSMVNLLCDEYGMEVEETPVGPKHFCPRLIDPKDGVLIAGEESGGFGVAGHIPDRDGMLVGLYYLQMMAMRGSRNRPRAVSQLVDDLMKKVGQHDYRRIDTRTDPATKDRVLDRLANDPPDKFGRFRVDRLDTRFSGIFDGYKFYFGNGEWILIRASGTEPLLRMYCEAHSEKDVNTILNAARRLLLGG